jgi:hypothetical protein
VTVLDFGFEWHTACVSFASSHVTETFRENQIFYGYPDSIEVQSALYEAWTRDPQPQGWTMLLKSPETSNRLGGEFLWFQGRKQLIRLLKGYPLLWRSSVDTIEEQKLVDDLGPAVREILESADRGTTTMEAARKKINGLFAEIDEEIMWWGPVQNICSTRCVLIASIREEFDEICEKLGERPTRQSYRDELLEFVFDRYSNHE